MYYSLKPIIERGRRSAGPNFHIARSREGGGRECIRDEVGSRSRCPIHYRAGSSHYYEPELPNFARRYVVSGGKRAAGPPRSYHRAPSLILDYRIWSECLSLALPVEPVRLGSLGRLFPVAASPRTGRRDATEATSARAGSLLPVGIPRVSPSGTAGERRRGGEVRVKPPHLSVFHPDDDLTVG